MQFLSPWFLLGAFAVAVPIWVHLIRSEEAQRIAFSSLMFLRKVPLKSASRQKLKHLALLAARTALLVLLALAFARPFFPGGAPSLLTGSGSRHRVILLDTSLSMQIGDRWQRATQAAGEVIDDVSENDVGQIVTFSSDFEIQNLPSADRAALRATLAGLQPTAGTTSYEHAFRAIERIQEDSGRALAVTFISDLQKSGAGGNAQGLSVPPVAEFKVVDVGSAATPNFAVSDVRVRPLVFGGRYPERLVAQVRGFGTEVATRDFTLSVTGKVIQRKTVTVPASGMALVSFDPFDVPQGINRGEVRAVTADELPADDVFQFSLERREPFRVLFLRNTGDEGELFYFRNALAAEANSPWQLEVRTPGDDTTHPLNQYALVILSNVPRIPNELADGLRALVQRGGGIIITAGNRFPAPELEQQLAAFWPAHATQKRLLTRDAERLILLGEYERSHAIFRDLEDAGGESLRAVQAYGYLSLQTDGSPESKVLMRFANADPALVERQYMGGRVLLLATALDNIWNDFPLHPVFIPFVHQMMRYAGGYPSDPPAYRIPSTLSLQNFARAGQAGQAWDAIGPDGKRVVAFAQENRADFLLLRQPGFYEITQRAEKHLIAANIDPSESDLQPLPEEDRKLLAPATDTQGPAAVTGAPESEKKQSFWWILMVMALAAALIEMVLAFPFLTKQRVLANVESQPAMEGEEI
ncbi:MAG: VWA domain-containing protein [Acidobacteria bacterium]|nr:VWA domain-containing protein [Acidobacteriota bacterium]